MALDPVVARGCGYHDFYVNRCSHCGQQNPAWVIVQARIAELEAEVKRLTSLATARQRAIEHGGGCVEDGGAWEDRARAAEAEVERLSRRPDLSPAQCAALASKLAADLSPWLHDDPSILAALRAAAEQEDT